MANYPAMSEPPSPPPTFRAHDRWSAHVLTFVLLGGLFLCIMIGRLARPRVLGEPVAIEPARVEQAQQRLDPNVASEAELACLPDIGEVTAHNIVAHRQARRRAAGGDDDSVVVFASPADLGAVKGIGDKTVERIGPYLTFPGP